MHKSVQRSTAQARWHLCAARVSWSGRIYVPLFSLSAELSFNIQLELIQYAWEFTPPWRTRQLAIICRLPNGAERNRNKNYRNIKSSSDEWAGKISPFFSITLKLTAMTACEKTFGYVRAGERSIHVVLLLMFMTIDDYFSVRLLLTHLIVFHLWPTRKRTHFYFRRTFTSLTTTGDGSLSLVLPKKTQEERKRNKRESSSNSFSAFTFTFPLSLSLARARQSH